MKILLINDISTPTGGGELTTLALRDGLRKRGHDARFFSSSACYMGRKGLADYECMGTTSPLRIFLQTANPWAYWKLRQVLATFQPHVVHVRIFLSQLSPLILPLLRDIPSIYHVVWYRPICPLGTKLLPDNNPCRVHYGTVCYQNRCLRLRAWVPIILQLKCWHHWRHAFNLVIANSAAVRDRLTADGIAPVQVVWNGIPERPARVALQPPPTVAFAGKFNWTKGVDVLVRAFAKVVKQIPEARLLLAGYGPEHEALKRLIAELDLTGSISMLGFLAPSVLETQFDRAWVQIVPSRWEEPFGRVAAEAQMRGTAVVASASGGLTEIVQDGQTGLLVPPGDVDALSDALLHLLQNRLLAEQLGQAGRYRALAEFSEDIFVDRFVQYYHTLC